MSHPSGERPGEHPQPGNSSRRTSPTRGEGQKPFLERPIGWVTVIGGCLAILSGIVALLFQLFPDWQPERDGTPSLKVADFNVEHEENIQADAIGEDGKKTKVEEWPSSMITVTIRNEGDDPVLIRNARFKFHHIDEFSCDGGGGLGWPIGRYDVKLAGEKSGAVVDRKMRWTIPPHDQETVAFTVGPKGGVNMSVSLYRFQITLERDEGDKVELPVVAHAAPLMWIEMHGKGSPGASSPPGNSEIECWKKEWHELMAFTETGDVKSPEFRSFYSRVKSDEGWWRDKEK
ncbi:hypothetical protein ACVILE_003152 [Streptomyces sp. M18.1]